MIYWSLMKKRKISQLRIWWTLQASQIVEWLLIKGLEIKVSLILIKIKQIMPFLIYKQLKLHLPKEEVLWASI